VCRFEEAKVSDTANVDVVVIFATF